MAKLYDMTYEELVSYVRDNGWPAFRADQIFSWCARGVGIASMTNLSKEIREALSALGTGGVSIEERVESSDGSEKYLFRCEDGNAVEGILMQYSYGGSLCISTQAGCRMGCLFCASGEAGLERNLSAGEMAGELYAVRNAGRTFNHVVLMGCGEPLDNFENVLKFLGIVTYEKGLNLSMRHISLSTCGLVPQMDALAKLNLPLTLCISLHASDDETRKRLMPVARRYSIAQVMDAARRYEKSTGRRVVFEYILIKGVNDSTEAAMRLSRLVSGMPSHVNVIPLNGNPNGLTSPDDATVRKFTQMLSDGGTSVTVRRRLGADVSGACGQLRLYRN